MTFLLDANVVSYFLQARREAELAAAASAVPCAIVEEVRVELAHDSQRGTRFEQWLPTSNLRVLSIEIGSLADEVLQALDPGITKTRGKGERASIALAVTQPNLLFTCMDKGALWIALRELWPRGEHLVALPVFLRRMVDSKVMAGEVAEDVMSQSRHVKPTWWAGWRTAQS